MSSDTTAVQSRSRESHRMRHSMNPRVHNRGYPATICKALDKIPGALKYIKSPRSNLRTERTTRPACTRTIKAPFQAVIDSLHLSRSQLYLYLYHAQCSIPQNTTPYLPPPTYAQYIRPMLFTPTSHYQIYHRFGFPPPIK